MQITHKWRAGTVYAFPAEDDETATAEKQTDLCPTVAFYSMYFSLVTVTKILTYVFSMSSSENKN